MRAPVGGRILQQGGCICHLLDITSIRKVKKILDFHSPGGDILFDPPARHGRVFRLHLKGECLTR